ncbi:hypothetical protein LSH36_2996g00000 [Paralvinella palmiformis]|uniref:Uncharacterized protein n=1 Tax=Paralvinella palmiformis TaxID=53620 RepID=A0AAD9IQ01_9ANNE|nr:hypothetical protein LSH36_2996g00000 [Paralvinella palmiformis]
MSVEIRTSRERGAVSSHSAVRKIVLRHVGNQELRRKLSESSQLFDAGDRRADNGASCRIVVIGSRDVGKTSIIS